MKVYRHHSLCRPRYSQRNTEIAYIIDSRGNTPQHLGKSLTNYLKLLNAELHQFENLQGLPA